MRVSKKDFLKEPNKYIKEGSFILTFYGKDLFIVKVSALEKVSTDMVITIPKKEPKVSTIIDGTKGMDRGVKIHPQLKTADSLLQYGCGCVKSDLTLCSKHDRV